MFSSFVVFFSSLSFLGYWFGCCFVMFFRGLGFLFSGRFGGGFVMFFRGLSFLFSGRFHPAFFTDFSLMSARLQAFRTH